MFLYQNLPWQSYLRYKGVDESNAWEYTRRETYEFIQNMFGLHLTAM